MGKVLASLLPLIVGAAMAPLWITATLLLLRSEGGLPKAAAFAAGATTVRLLQGVLFGLVFDATQKSGGIHFVASTLLLMTGIVLLITFVKAWSKEDDPDAPPPQWLKSIDRVSPLAALGIGASSIVIGLKQWVFTLSAIAVIDEARLNQKGTVLAYLFFVVAAQALILAPILARAAAPAQSARMLEAMQGWLGRRNRAITMAGSLVFGVWFLAKGANGLLT